MAVLCAQSGEGSRKFSDWDEVYASWESPTFGRGWRDTVHVLTFV